MRRRIKKSERRDNDCGLPRWKRCLDLSLILLSLPVTIPLAGLIALCVRLCSPGCIIFQQERVGYQGRRFRCLKFRSMKVNAETAGHQDYLHQIMGSEKPMTKLDDRGDHRLLPCGVLLRATGLDELPQLINIWRGEMSLVGPRPCLPYEYEKYSDWQKRRFEVVPGLTGLWQVSGKNRTTFNQMIQLDIAYAERQSLWLDLKIIVRTPWALGEQVFASLAARARGVFAPAGNSLKEQSYE